MTGTTRGRFTGDFSEIRHLLERPRVIGQNTERQRFDSVVGRQEVHRLKWQSDLIHFRQLFVVAHP